MKQLKKSAKDMEMVFQEDHELFTKLISAIPDAVILTDMQGKIIFVNDVGIKLLGYSSAEEDYWKRCTFVYRHHNSIRKRKEI